MCGRLLNPHFMGVLCFIALNYFVFVYEYMIGLRPSAYVWLLVGFHVFFGLLIWSMTKAISGDPGRVPIYWGFFAEESENRKRRYCLLCHSFKPERYLLLTKMPSLFHLSAMRAQHGPPLSLDCQLRGLLKSQIFHVVSFLHHRNANLLSLLRDPAFHQGVDGGHRIKGEVGPAFLH